jgi:hypothetical protein
MSSSTISWPALVAVVLSSSVISTIITKVFDRSGANIEVLRKGYADATDALNRWGQFPLRIRRRTDDSPETRSALEALGAQIQERLAYSTGWVATESAPVSEIYNRLVTILRTHVAIHARRAWNDPPATDPKAMNLGRPPSDDQSWAQNPGLIPPEWVVVQLFSKTFRYRFEWRRYLLPPFYLRWRFSHIGIENLAAEAFRSRPTGRESAR